MNEIQVIMPAGAFGASPYDDALDTFLRELAVKVSPNPREEWAEKYGTDYANDVFQMHQFCWCDGDDCPWCGGCICEDATCAWCRNEPRWAEYGALPPNEPPFESAPHFWHKASGFRVWWYKYIGRGVETYGEMPAGMFAECLASLGEEPKP